ncbi:hypothetical protein BJY16_003898 [Actinoplanes octamycinicus]|uniref:Regulator of septum formation n=1 Tax=Actinoplanes octamycinicus TaxID=135948 RepID=A0A7W7GY39_9ACTN|nr:DUF4190 domain-containing protein [Actinoplanes octamycinicus]MBB4740439.1 hypothetical protein [Actinoplanes octamycinicus]GIE59699.1 hypothetical protein Aoc01nite_51010 [Actinoplanes octamycinicus]
MNEDFPGQPGYPPPGPPPPDPLAAPPTTPMYGTPPPSYAATPPPPPQPYGAYPPAAYPGQQPPGQPFPGQPAAGQPFPGQPAAGQPFPGQPVPGQPYPGQPYPPAGFPPPGFPPPPGYPGYGPQKTNGAAIASLIFGILGGVLISVICGFIALSQIKKRGDRGKGMAVAGLSLSAFWVVAIAGLIVIGSLADPGTSADAGPTGLGARPTATATTAGDPDDVRTDKLRPGDCIATITDEDTVYDMPVISCAQPHQGEVYSVTTMAAGTFPGDKAVETEAENRCGDKLDPYAIGKFKDAEFYYIFPSRRSWTSDRSITCIAVAPDNGTYTGSMVK